MANEKTKGPTRLKVIKDLLDYLESCLKAVHERNRPDTNRLFELASAMEDQAILLQSSNDDEERRAIQWFLVTTSFEIHDQMHKGYHASCSADSSLQTLEFLGDATIQTCSLVGKELQDLMRSGYDKELARELYWQMTQLKEYAEDMIH